MRWFVLKKLFIYAVIFGLPHNVDYFFHFRNPNDLTFVFYTLAKKFCNTSFNILNDLLTTLRICKRAFYRVEVSLQLCIGVLIYMKEKACKIYINCLIHCFLIFEWLPVERLFEGRPKLMIVHLRRAFRFL